MSTLTNLWAAVKRLAAAVNGLAATAEAADAELRQRLGLDDQPALEHEANGNGRLAKVKAR